MSRFARRLQQIGRDPEDTGAILDLADGPGGPILVLRSSTNKFSDYYAEVLRAEGLNSFASRDIADVSAPTLANYTTIVVGDFSLTSGQITMLSDWVTDGGHLFAMRPDKQLAPLAGLVDESATLADGYLLVDTQSSPGHGIVGQTLQYHGTADCYTLSGDTRAVATLYSTATSPTPHVAVSLREVGSNGGTVCAFTFDLARSLVYSHQGNPAWAGQERDGLTPIRPDDLFFGNASGDPQPDYVNMGKVAIPQADELQRLLSNAIQHVHLDRYPLPKFWYFPNGKKAVLLMSGDDHAVGGTSTTFDYMVAQSPVGGTVENWGAIRATSWIYTATPLSDAQAAAYHAQGFDIGVHVNTNAQNWTPASLDAAFASDLAGFRAKYTSLPNQTGNRTHAIVWSDYFSTPVVELKYGIRMDLNYYYWPNSFVQNRPGFFTGSGLSMRFADVDGTMIDVYQVPTHLVNESGMQFPTAIHTQLERAVGPEGYYGILGTHYDYTDNFDQQLVQAALTYDIPAVSAQQVLDWVDGRNASHFTTPFWEDNVLHFHASTDAKVGQLLRGMLPIITPVGVLSDMTYNDEPLNYTVEAIKGIQYAIFAVMAGGFSATYEPDVTAPTVIASTPANGAVDINPADSSITVEFSEQIDAATITSSTVTLFDAGNSPVAATLSISETNNGTLITIQLSATLAEGTTYSVVVRGGTAPHIADASGNALASNYSWSFTTGVQQYSLWYPSIPSVSTASGDTDSVELGTRFTTTQDGSIEGIRFYKSTNDQAQHTVTLWDNTGAIMGTATTASESATGWQVATFAMPITVTTGVTYVASYRASVGQYSYTQQGLATSYTHTMLTAAQSGGVFSYTTAMPNQSFNNSNYWVDVVFKIAQ